MPKFRKKPVEIEAYQWNKDDPEEVLNWLMGRDTLEYRLVYDGQVPDLFLGTLEGEMHVSQGDYIIKGVQDEFYPCKEDIFAQTYDPA